MMTAEERETIIVDALRFLAGDEDEDAEDAYHGITLGNDPQTEWSLLEEVANRSDGIVDAMTIGIGLVMSFIIHHGSSQPEIIAEGIQRNVRLQHALRHVRGVHMHPELVALLPETLTFES